MNTPVRERFIPFRKRDIINMILEDGRFHSEQEKKDFSSFSEIVGSIFHFRFHKELEKLKDSYYPINPDINKNTPPAKKEIDAANGEIHALMRTILNDANYNRLSQDEINKAMKENALVGFNVKIDFEAYDFAEIYTRGLRTDTFPVKKFFGLKNVTVQHDILERVILLARLKSSDDKTARSDSTFIKMFKDVPKEDLEILFPNSRVTMSLKDKLLLIIPAVAGGIPLLATRVIPALTVAFIIISAYFGINGTVEENQLKQTIAVFTALGALAGFLFRQWTKYKTRKFEFQKELSDNLYFRNLVNNSGVFYSLIDAAEEEECKETFLAYYFLLVSKNGLTEEDLDKQIEDWMEKNHNCLMDFECSDAVDKLKKLDLLIPGSGDLLKVQPIRESLALLDRKWDNFFQY